jgi:membrane-bound ClpP family serine protease
MMDDFPKRIADLLETAAARIRSLTIDPVARLITFITLGMVALTLVSLAVIFLLIGILRITGELIYKACDCSGAMEISYAIVGGLFLVIAGLLWSRRTRSAPRGD